MRRLVVLAVVAAIIAALRSRSIAASEARLFADDEGAGDRAATSR
jgi:hypothetical protein